MQAFVPNTELSDRKALIYKEAAYLFREKGYAASSLRDLAAQVGLKAPSLYNHIQSKEMLLRDICFSNAHRFLEGLEEIESSSASTVDKIEALIRLHIRIARTHPSSVLVFSEEWRHLSEPWLTDFLVLRRDYENRFLHLIDKGMEAGQLSNIHPKIALYSLINALKWVHYPNKKIQEFAPEDLEQDIISFILNGLRKA